MDLPQLLDICYTTSYPFGFPSISKRPPLDTLKFLVATLMIQDKKFRLIQVDEYGSLAISFEFMKICHNMNITVQTTGGNESSLNSKTEIPNKTLANTTRYFILKSSHNT